MSDIRRRAQRFVAWISIAALLLSGIAPAYAQGNLWGRLTIAEGVCNTTSDHVAQTTLWYAPCDGDQVLISNGVSLTPVTFAASATDQVGLALPLWSSLPAQTLYDVFVVLNGGSPTLCLGPAWMSSAAGASARAAPLATFLDLVNGGSSIVNAAPMPCQYSASSYFSCPQYQCSELGYFLSGALPGTIDLKFGTGAVGCGAAILSLYNTHKRYPVRATVSDTTYGAWTYASNNWRPAHGSLNCSIAAVAGVLGSDGAANASYVDFVGSAVAGAVAFIGLGLNSSTVIAGRQSVGIALANSSPLLTLDTAFLTDNLPLGLNIIYALEISDGVHANTFSGSNGTDGVITNMQLTLNLEM